MDVFAPYEQAEQHAHSEQQRAVIKAENCDAAMREAINDLMAKPQGRVLLRWLLHLCRNFSAENVDRSAESAQSAHLFHTEGRRMIGMSLIRLMQQANPEHLPNLLLTKENDAHDCNTF